MKITYLPVWASGLLLASSVLISYRQDLMPTTPAHLVNNAKLDCTGIFKQGTFRAIPITYQEVVREFTTLEHYLLNNNYGLRLL